MEEIKAVLETRAKSYQQMLFDEGYAAKTPVWDENSRTWDMIVKFEGITVLVMLDVDDAEFVRVVVPNFWDVEPQHLGSALLAADMTNKQCKGAKVALNQARSDSVALTEFLDVGEQVTGKLLVRYLSMCVSAARFYVAQTKEQIEEKCTADVA